MLYVPVLLLIIIAAVFLLLQPANHSSESSSSDSHNAAHVEIKVSGMVCDGCAGMIEAKLVELNGVNSAKASFPDSNVIVSYHPELTHPDSLSHAIEKKGYKVEKIVTYSPEN